MRPSDEKARAIVHGTVRAIEQDPSLRIVDREAALKAVRQALQEVLSIHDEIDAAAEARIRSLSRRVKPGTREWSDLYAQYASEERRKRGL